MNQYREGKVKSTPTRGVKQYLKPNAYNQSELDWTLMIIWAIRDLIETGRTGRSTPRVADRRWDMNDG